MLATRRIQARSKERGKKIGRLKKGKNRLKSVAKNPKPRINGKIGRIKRLAKIEMKGKQEK